DFHVTGVQTCALPILLVVDDDSPDGTGDLADALAADDGGVHVLHRPEKRGLGAAYLAAFEWAARRGYRTVVEMDADGSHDPADQIGRASCRERSERVT